MNLIIIILNMTHQHPLIYLIRKYPNKPWDWTNISLNTSLSLKDIENNLDLPWVFHRIAQRSDITMNFVSKHQHNFGFNGLANISINIAISLNIIEDNPNFPWNYYDGVSYKKNLTLDFVLKYPNKNWNWPALTSNKGIKVSEILAYPNPEWWKKDLSDNPTQVPWWISCISENRSLTPDDVLNNPDFPWNYLEVCKILFMYHEFDFDFVKAYVDQKDWKELSECISESVNLDDIDANPEFPWDYFMLLFNPTVNIDFVLKHKNEHWEWINLTVHRGIKLQDILNHPELRWRSQMISTRHDISLSEIKNLKLVITHKWLNSKSNILTVDFIEQNINQNFNWDNVSNHNFKYDRQVYAVKLVEKLWRKAVFLRRLNHWRQLKIVHREFYLEPPHSSIGFPGGKNYWNLINNWDKHIQKV